MYEKIEQTLFKCSTWSHYFIDDGEHLNKCVSDLIDIAAPAVCVCNKITKFVSNMMAIWCFDQIYRMMNINYKSIVIVVFLHCYEDAPTEARGKKERNKIMRIVRRGQKCEQDYSHCWCKNLTSLVGFFQFAITNFVFFL